MTRTLLSALCALFVFGLITEVSAQTVPRPPRKGRKYTVKIDSAPQTAAIYLDDKAYGIVGYTPFTGKLVRGNYTLIIELQGYETYSRPITVDSRNKEFFAPLTKRILPATIDIQASADQHVLGAQVFVDAVAEGSAPNLVDVPAGRHFIELKKPGFITFGQWVDVKQGERLTLTPMLKPEVVAPKTGGLIVDADVADAEVIVDGVRQPDTTPTIVDNLTEGPHVVEVRKAPAVPWKSTVMVVAGTRTKVNAGLAATLQQNQGGNVRVLSNVEGADVFLDGQAKGKVPVDLQGVSPGIHLVEVRALGHESKEERVAVNAGQAVILKVDLAPVAKAANSGILKVVTAVPDARVFIDGVQAGQGGTEREVPAGKHFVTVQQTGYSEFKQEVTVEAGQTFTVVAELLAIGTLRFLANTEGAEVLVDGVPIGNTPLVKEDIAVGEHIVTIRKAGHYDFETPVKVEAGKSAIVNAEMRVIETGLTPQQILEMKRGLTSYGARVMPYGSFTTDFAIGFPYWIEARATVGVVNKPTYGWDIGLAFRSLLTTWEVLGTGRYRFFQMDPFAFAFFGTIGGGGGAAGRNQFTLQGGAIASITFRDRVTVSGRGYIDIWSDRLCPVDPAEAANAPEVCRGLGDTMRALSLTGEQSLQERDVGVRLYLSMVVEAAFYQYVGGFLIFEGAPFQSERAAHTDLFNRTMFAEDPIYNVKVGATMKF